MLANTYTPDGYFVGTDGAWSPKIEQITQDYNLPQSGIYTYENPNEFWSFSISVYTGDDGYEGIHTGRGVLRWLGVTLQFISYLSKRLNDIEIAPILETAGFFDIRKYAQYDRI